MNTSSAKPIPTLPYFWLENATPAQKAAFTQILAPLTLPASNAETATLSLELHLNDNICRIHIANTTYHTTIALPCSAAHLVDSLRTLLQKPPIQNGFTLKNRQLQHQSEQKLLLTELEEKLLLYLQAHFPHSVTKEMLLENVWGYHHNTTTHTVETAFYRLRQKLATCWPNHNLIENLENGGYVLAEKINIV